MGTSIELNGAQLVNNGTQTGALTGVVHVNYGSTLKGTGDFSGANITVGGGGQYGNNGLSGGAPAAAFAAPAGVSPFWHALRQVDRAGGGQPFVGPQLDTTPQITNVGGLTLAANSTFNFNLQNTEGAPGVGYDLTHAGSGGLTLTGGTTPGTQIVIRLIGLDGTGANGPVGNFDPAQPYQSTLVQSDGGITGYQPGEFLVNTASFPNATNGGTFSVVRQGNNLVLAFAPVTVPEPAAWVLLAVGMAGGWLLVRRRGRA